ncbi:hypothetical protein CHS0354_018428 [Potamilus streckersoni]|uniref:Uncharacterized protein n=1 Tax=Potamilus streckersoni TaxID=2493646 RepID=A0AAE0TAK5_9BIVA|nr:hypothetical protein CHS0354_018428 [Potamilus streckersoni]
MNYPSDTSAGLHNGKFTGGDPNTGLPPSRLSADWMNAVSDELIAVITQFGGTPQENDRSQVSSVLRSADTALRTLIDNAVPVGSVFHIAAPEAPAGFIVCNGAQVDRTLYSRLFNLFFKNADGTARFVAKTVTAVCCLAVCFYIFRTRVFRRGASALLGIFRRNNAGDTKGIYPGNRRLFEPRQKPLSEKTTQKGPPRSPKGHPSTGKPRKQVGDSADIAGVFKITPRGPGFGYKTRVMKKSGKFPRGHQKSPLMPRSQKEGNV